MIEERATTPTPAGPRNGEDTDMQGYEGNHTGGESAAQQTRTNGTTLPSASQTGGGGGQASQSRFSRPSTSVYLDRELFSVYTEEGRGPDYEESSDDGGNDLFIGPPSPRTAAEIHARGPLHGSFEADAEIQRRRNKHLERYQKFVTATQKSRLRYLDSVTRNKIWDREQATSEAELRTLEGRKAELENRLLAMRSARENYNTEFEVLIQRGRDEEVVHREFDDFLELRSDESPDFERLRKWDV
ncbi:hypothetical protein MBLNU230_g4836t1 [Neophaeotheca triangularis]